MNRDERNPEQMLDQVIEGIRNEQFDPEVLEQSRRRAWERFKHSAKENVAATPSRIASCSDFRALLPDYIAGTLAEARRMLVEDHTHECVACRRALRDLSEPAPPRLVEMPARRSAPGWRKYAIAASLLITGGVAGWRAYNAFGPAPAGNRAVVQAATGSVFLIANGVLQAVSSGTEIVETDTVRTAAGARLMLRLHDGSDVEVGERAELGVSMGRSDTTLRLERGTVIVQAAKRRTGHLYVTSPDCRVAVTGTVFAVNRGVKGSRVSVVEGSVQVEHGGREVTLRPGDQVSTDTSMASVPIRDEIAWSENLTEHLALLNAIVELKAKLDTIPMPRMRYGSRLMDYVPAETMMFASVPNAGQALSDAHRLFNEQVQLSPALQKWSMDRGKKTEEKTQRAIETLRRFSEYIGDEIVIALAARTRLRGQSPVFLAEVHRAGFREFLQGEIVKMNAEHPGAKIRIVDGTPIVSAPAQGEILVALRGNHVIASEDAASLDEAARNVDGSGGKTFASSEFGRRLSDKLRAGTGILVGIDLQRMSGLRPNVAKNAAALQENMLSIGADRVRYLIAEQKQVGAETQRSAELSFAGARTGVASWLGSPAPIGGLGFVSPDAQLVAAAVLKKPDQVIDDILAFKSDAARVFEEARKHLGIDIQRDFAALLGGEVTFAIDGPLVPTPSWKLTLEVTDPVRLQQTIERVVKAANLAVQLSGRRGYELNSETVEASGALFGASGPLAFHVIRSLDEATIPEIHYVYTGGYLVAAPNRALLTKAIQVKQSGVTLVRSDRFRKLLPRDERANFSAIVYQNAGQWLGTVANALGSEQQRTAGELAAKVGPILVCAYGEQDRIEIVNKGSAWDVVMQSFVQPVLNRGTRAPMRSY
jgi:hypothetical protein